MSTLLSPALRAELGKRAGVTAGLLGVLCIFAEFCFLFPHLLVTNDARGFYADHIGVFRALLQGSILLTFALGMVSVLSLRSKAHGGIAMALAGVALLMGGAEAEPLTQQSRALSAGLDYFILDLLVLGLLFIPMERLWAQREQPIFRVGWRTGSPKLGARSPKPGTQPSSLKLSRAITIRCTSLVPS